MKIVLSIDRANETKIFTVIFICFEVDSMCILLLWQKTATLFNLQQALYAFGTMTISLLTRQFLTGPRETDKLMSNNSNLTPHQPLNTAVPSYIYWPFFMGSVLQFLIFISFLAVALVPTPNEIKKQFSKRQTSGTDTFKCRLSNQDKSSMNHYILVLVLLFAADFLLGACHSSFIQYTFITAVKINNGFNQKDAAILNTVISGISCLSPLLTSLTSYYVPVRIVTLTLAFSAIFPDVLLILFGIQSYTMFWIFATLKAFLIAPGVPLSIAFVDSYIELAGGLLSIFEAMFFSGCITQYFINGYLLEYNSTWTLLVFGVALTVLIFISQFGAFLFAGTGCKKESTRVNQTDDEEEMRLIEQQ